MTAAADLRACPVCDGRDAEVLRRERFVLVDGHPLADGYDVVCCRRCGMVYADTRVPQSAYDRFYAELSKYADEQTGTGGGESAGDRARLREMAADLAEHASRAGRVVDVGCANGGLLRELLEVGFTDVVGVDPSPACVRHARGVAGARAYEGSLFALPPEAADADLLVLSHVLEHVQDVAGAIAAARERVAPAGRIYVEVPDAMRYAAFVTAPFQDFNTEHINHFSATSLTALLERSGFAAVAAGTRDMDAAPGVPYPAAWVLAVRRDGAGGGAAAAGPVGRDAALRAAIVDYIAASDALLARIDARLAELARGGAPIVVWGVGETTKRLLAPSALGRANIAAFVDSNAMYHGKRLRGAPILAPAALRDLPHPVLVGSLVNAAAIRAAVDRLQLPNAVVTLDVTPPSQRARP